MIRRLLKIPNEKTQEELDAEWLALMERTRRRQIEACEALKRAGKHSAYGYHPPKERILSTFLAERTNAKAQQEQTGATA